MGSKITVLASGLILGMALVVACEPLYKRLNDTKKDAYKQMKKTTNKAETALADVKQKVTLKTDEALDTINGKIDDLIQSVDDIDISKLKGKSKMALEAMKQKVKSLKQD